jgi:hypothetical protein
MRREKRKEPRMKERIEVPDFTQRQGWERGWPETPRPT